MRVFLEFYYEIINGFRINFQKKLKLKNKRILIADNTVLIHSGTRLLKHFRMGSIHRVSNYYPPVASIKCDKEV